MDAKKSHRCKFCLFKEEFFLRIILKTLDTGAWVFSHLEDQQMVEKIIYIWHRAYYSTWSSVLPIIMSKNRLAYPSLKVKMIMKVTKTYKKSRI